MPIVGMDYHILNSNPCHNIVEYIWWQEIMFFFCCYYAINVGFNDFVMQFGIAKRENKIKNNIDC